MLNRYLVNCVPMVSRRFPVPYNSRFCREHVVKQTEKKLTILMADNDPDDFMLANKAILGSFADVKLKSVHDSTELMEYLRCCYSHSLSNDFPLPNLILLDFNLPGKDSFGILKEISADRNLRGIPVIVMSTSENKEDIKRSYELGANTFLKKPNGFTIIVKVIKSLMNYWE